MSIIVILIQNHHVALKRRTDDAETREKWDDFQESKENKKRWSSVVQLNFRIWASRGQKKRKEHEKELGFLPPPPPPRHRAGSLPDYPQSVYQSPFPPSPSPPPPSPPLPIFYIIHPLKLCLSFSDIYLILSHFLCSHLLNLLLHLFSNFIFRLPTSLPPPPAYLSSISVLQTGMWSLLGKACQLSLCSRIFWLFSERLSVQRGTLRLWFIFWAVSYFRKRDFKKGHTTSCSPWRYCNNKYFFFQSVSEGAKNRALYCRRKEV